jgi:membrane protease YdiL (CAAX protease family)
MESANKEPTYLIFPDYKWSARDAWKCILVLICFEFISAFILSWLSFFYAGLHNWLHSESGYFLLSIFYSGIYLFAVAYFARTESWKTFFEGFGLNRKPSDYVWFGMVFAIVVVFVSHFIFSHGWVKGYAPFDIKAFRRDVTSERYFYLAPMLLAPFFEEPVFRGFLYKAFRGSYSITVSTILILAVTCLAHWSQYSHSMLSAISISSVTIIQCYLREKSNSLWDCIFCHLAFNASGLFIGGILR